MISSQHNMVSCKHGKAGSYSRQQIVLGLLSTFPFRGELVLLRADAPCASKGFSSIAAVSQRRKLFWAEPPKKENTQVCLPLSSLFNSAFSPTSPSHFHHKNSHPGPGIPLLAGKLSFLYNH